MKRLLALSLFFAHLAFAGQFADSSLDWRNFQSVGNPVTVNFSSADTFVTKDIPIRGSITAREFKILLNPALAQISNVQIGEDLLQGPEDSEGTLWLSPSGDAETFSGVIKVTLLKQPTDEPESATLQVLYGE